MVQNFCWGRVHMHCVDVLGIHVSTQCVYALHLMEVMCYSVFEHGNAIKKCNRIIFDFYMKLSHMYICTVSEPQVSEVPQVSQFTLRTCHSH